MVKYSKIKSSLFVYLFCVMCKFVVMDFGGISLGQSAGEQFTGSSRACHCKYHSETLSFCATLYSIYNLENPATWDTLCNELCGELSRRGQWWLRSLVTIFDCFWNIIYWYVGIYISVDQVMYSEREKSCTHSLRSTHFIWFLRTWVTAENSSKCVFFLISMLG